MLKNGLSRGFEDIWFATGDSLGIRGMRQTNVYRRKTLPFLPTIVSTPLDQDGREWRGVRKEDRLL